jgi:hypothetical protein
MSGMTIAFSRPFAWLPGGCVESISEVEEGRTPGLYMWTAPSPAGHLVYYVGDTGLTLAGRIQEHLCEQLSGRYRFYEPGRFFKGDKQLLWRGVYGHGAKRNVSEFVDQLPILAPALVQFVRSMRFLVATTDCPVRLRRRIEAALSSWFRQQDGLVGPFQEDGIHYEPRVASEPPETVAFTWQERPLGAPDRLEV